MKIETVGTVDGENAVTITFEDGKLTGATFASGMRKLMDDMATGDFVVLLGGLAAAVDAFRRATGLLEPPVQPKPVKTLTVGDTVTEPGRYIAVDRLSAKMSEVNRAVGDIVLHGNEQTLDALLDAVRSVQVPEPPAQEPVAEAPEEPTVPDAPAPE